MSIHAGLWQRSALSSMSSLWWTTRMSGWMTPTLTTVLIRPFLNLFFCKRAATDVLKTIDPTQFYTSTSVTATDRLRTMNSRGLCHADCQVGALYFSAVRHLFRVLLLLIFLPRTSNSCSSAETPSSSSPRFMLARPARGFPQNKCFIGDASDSLVKAGFTLNVQSLLNVFLAGKGDQNGFCRDT